MSEYRLRIEQDTDCEGPTEWGNDAAFIVANHRQFAPTAPKGWDTDRARNLLHGADSGFCAHCGEEIIASETGWELVDSNDGCTSDNGQHTPEVNPDTEHFVAYPLHAYIHSGIALSLGTFSDPWDSEQIGYVVVDKREFEGYLRAVAESTVIEWNQYLSGDVWGYIIERIDTCSLGHEHAEVIESCWNFYGREVAEQEGNAMMKHYTEGPKID